jgi:hypothetical protein
MFDIEYGNLSPESQANYIQTDIMETPAAEPVSNEPTTSTLYLHLDACLFRAPLKLIGRPSRNVWRVKHPSLKYAHFPQNFITKNKNAKSNADWYMVEEPFTQMKISNIPNICIYFGTYADGVNADTKCKNHAHCQEFHSYLLSEGIQKYISECNSLEKVTSMDVTYTWFNQSNPKVSENNKLLCRKVKNCFWFEKLSESSLTKVVGNIVIPQGVSSFPLISTITNDNSYELKVNNSTFPELVSARIFNNRVYINTLEAFELTSDSHLGTVSAINTALATIYDHKLVHFEILHFKNSAWSRRALTDATVSFFLNNTTGHEIQMHWSYATPQVRKLYTEMFKHNDKITDKKEFLAYLESEDIPVNLIPSQQEITEVKSTLLDNRTFWYLVPKGFNLVEFTAKMNCLMSGLKVRQTLPFKSYESAFNCEESFFDIESINGFFKTVNMIKGETCLLLMKPNFTTMKNYQLFNKIMGSYGTIVKFDVKEQISMTDFSKLYPNCLNRPYGEAWHQYLVSGPVIPCIYVCDNIKVARQKMLKLRIESDIIWIKNIAHFSSSKEESVRDLDIFFPNSDIQNLNGELLMTYLNDQPTPVIQSPQIEEDESMFDENGLPIDFPSNLKSNPDIVQFMRYIAYTANTPKKSNKRQKTN